MDVYCIYRYVVVVGFGLTALMFLLIALFAILGGLLTSDVDGLYIGIVVPVFAAFFLGIPTLVMRWSVMSLKADLEEELRGAAKHK